MSFKRPLSSWAMLKCERICIIEPVKYCLCVCMYLYLWGWWHYMKLPLTPETWLPGQPPPTKEKKNVSLAWHSWKNQDLLKRHKVYNTKEAEAVGVYHSLSSDDSSRVPLGFASLLNCGVFGDLWQQSNQGNPSSAGRSSIRHSVQRPQRTKLRVTQCFQWVTASLFFPFN